MTMSATAPTTKPPITAGFARCRITPLLSPRQSRASWLSGYLTPVTRPPTGEKLTDLGIRAGLAQDLGVATGDDRLGFRIEEDRVVPDG